jgi:hypothetical protein
VIEILVLLFAPFILLLMFVFGVHLLLAFWPVALIVLAVVAISKLSR